MDEWSQIKLLNVAQSSECGVRTRHPKPPVPVQPRLGFHYTGASELLQVIITSIENKTAGHELTGQLAQSLFTTIFLGGQICTITSLF